MSAIKRIQKDILEWRESSRHFHNIAAEPFENDMFIWHFNVLVGSRSVALHGQIQFPRNYPFSPPRVSFFGNVPHKQVRNVSLGSVAGLCLDMLQESNQGYYSGWSSAYSVVSIFAQIETLLHSLSRTQISQYWCSFSCRQCGHNGGEQSSYFPAPIALPAAAVEDEKTSSEDGPRVWQLLNADVESVIFGFLGQADLQRLVVVDFHIQQVLYNLRVYHWTTVECYHSHCTFGDFCSLIGRSGMLRDEVLKNVFGIGFKTEYWDNNGSVLNNLHMSPDLLSFGAFSDGVNFSMWRDFEFTEFLPLCLNNEHGSYALPLAEEIIKRCYHLREATAFSPVLALRFLSKLMNTTVVSLMNEVEDQSDKVHLFTSTKALQSYLYCYHLLLGFARKYPGIVGYARTKVNDFLDKPDKRNKTHYPDLGEFLVYLALVENVPWSRFGPVFVEEAFTRNAKWILGEHPSLVTTHRNLEVSCVRLRKSWEVSMVGKRLQMFQYYFMKNVCGVGDETGMSDLKAKLHSLNRSLGQVPESVAVELQRRCRVIFQVDDWMQYYELINLPCPSAQRLSHMMRIAMVESDRKGYHRHVETPVGDSQPHENSKLCLCSGTIFDVTARERQLAEESKEVETTEDDERRYLDVAFSLDCTGSMWSYLNSVKDHIQQIADTLSSEGNIDVQFAIVGYRDHGHTETWPKVTKTHDFANVKKFKKNLTKYSCGGGGPPEEAVPDAWHQILALNWRRFSVKAVIHVADIACHGLETPSDECPAGHDPIDLAHQMLMADITLYNVGCKMWSDEHKDFYSGTAHMTGGVYLPLANSDKLPQLIVESTREGMSLSTIIPKVHGLMKKFREERPYATRDQLVYFVWRDLVEQNIVTRKVKCVSIDNEISERVLRISKVDNLAECRAILLETPAVVDDSDDDESTFSPPSSTASPTKSGKSAPARPSGTVNKFRTYDQYAKDLKRKQRQAKRSRARRRRRGQAKQAARDEEAQRLEEEKQALKEVVSSNDRLITFEQTLRCLNRAEQMGNRLEWMEKGCVYRMEKYSGKAARDRHIERGMEYSGKLVRIRRLKFKVGDKVEYKDAKKQRIYAAEVFKLDRANFSVIVRVTGFRNAKRTVSMTSRNLTQFGRFLTPANFQKHHSGVIDPRLSDEVREEVIAESRTGRKVVQPVPEASVRVQIGISRKDAESADLIQQIEKSNAPKFAQMVTVNEEEEKEFAVPADARAVSTVSRPRAVPHQYTLTRRDMVVKSALCVIPPMDLWGPIQEIRRVHDKSYDRWMPHINILYPYAPAQSFRQHVPHLSGAFQARCIQPFRVEFYGYDYFDRKPRADDPDPSLYVFLKTRVVRGDNKSWDLLMDVMKRVYPKYDMGRSAFKPHLTVAQVARSQVRSFVSDLNRRFVPSQFDIDSVCLISRSGFSSAFAVDNVVRF